MWRASFYLAVKLSWQEVKGSSLFNGLREMLQPDKEGVACLAWGREANLISGVKPLVSPDPVIPLQE